MSRPHVMRIRIRRILSSRRLRATKSKAQSEARDATVVGRGPFYDTPFLVLVGGLGGRRRLARGAERFFRGIGRA